MGFENILDYIRTYWQVFLLISICYLFLILTSGHVLKFILSYVSTKRKNELKTMLFLLIQKLEIRAL